MALSYVGNLCWSLWRLTKAVGNFNYHLVSTLFRFSKEAWSAACVFTTALTNASCDILAYLYEFLVEFVNFLTVLCQLATRLLTLVAFLLIWAYNVLEEAAVFIADALLFGLRWTWSSLCNGADAFAVSTRDLQDSMKCHLFSLCEALGQISHEATECLYVFIAKVIHRLSCSTLALGYCLMDRIHTGCAYVVSSVETIIDVCLDFCRVQCCGLREILPHYLSLYDVCLVAVVIIMLISLLRVLVITFRKYGLTIPFLGQYSFVHHISHRNISPEMQDDYIVISDEEDAVEAFNGSDEDSLETETSSETLTDEFTDEFEVVDDSDFESGDENDQNVINIQLTGQCQGYTLRERASHSPALFPNKLSPCELERYLESERDKRLCVVCQDKPKNVLVLPCKHVCMCVTCAQHIATSSNQNRRICPLCRSRISTIMDVFV